MLTAELGIDLPVAKPLTSMPKIVGEEDKDFDVPNGPVLDRT
jgi:hypothetical protein